jgi:superoxide dismutase
MAWKKNDCVSSVPSQKNTLPRCATLPVDIITMIFFWKYMSFNNNVVPTGSLATTITGSSGSFDAFKTPQDDYQFI